MVNVRRLIWSEGNIAHIARHEITPEQVEEVCKTDALVQEGHSGRLLIIGLTKLKKMLTIIVDSEPEKGVYYVVTARAASTRERRMYRVEKGDE